MIETNTTVLKKATNYQHSIVDKANRNGLLTIDFDHITKKFGNVLANDSVTCHIQSGGIHAFLGENGAGKSTLMKILAGYYQPDNGSINIDGKPVIFRSPAEARRLGIGMVHQQFTLVPSLTVLDNIVLGHPATPIILQPKKHAEVIAEKAAQYGIDLDLLAPISRLNMAQKQKVEILKLLSRDARILILDEPTSQLAPFEAEEILGTMDNLAVSGKIVILITHHIEELLRFAAVISVLRQGRLISSFTGKSVKAEELAQIMIGERFSEAKGGEDTRVRGECNEPRQRLNMIGDYNLQSASVYGNHSDVNQIVLKNVQVKASTTNRALEDINLEIKTGEVHGIAGVMGSGQDELASLLAGHLIPARGDFILRGKLSNWKSLRTPYDGVAYIPSDAKRGSLAQLTLAENLLLRGIYRKEFLAGPFIRRKQVAEMAHERITAFGVLPKSIFTLGGSLSGGNLQRLIIARELEKPAPLVVAVNPTAGLDLAMSLRIRNEFRQYAASGKSVLLISPDLDELLKTCDRISVMFAGTIVGTDYVSNLSAEKLGLLMGGNSLAAETDFPLAATSYNNSSVGVEQVSTG